MAPEDWCWSSYPLVVGRAPSPDFLVHEVALGLFSDDRPRARELFADLVNDGP